MYHLPLELAGWLRRLTVCNPLVRRSDRIEAIAILAVWIAVVACTPFAAALGTVVHDAQSHAYAAQRSDRHRISAVATRGSTVDISRYAASYVTPIEWRYGGRNHSGVVGTSKTMRTGEQQSVWVTSAGEMTTPPPSSTDAAVEAILAALGAWLVVIGLGAGGLTVLRHRLNHIRYACWDREFDDLADDGGRTGHKT
jgi:hypothetical protein